MERQRPLGSRRPCLAHRPCRPRGPQGNRPGNAEAVWAARICSASSTPTGSTALLPMAGSRVGPPPPALPPVGAHRAVRRDLRSQTVSRGPGCARPAKGLRLNRFSVAPHCDRHHHDGVPAHQARDLRTSVTCPRPHRADHEGPHRGGGHRHRLVGGKALEPVGHGRHRHKSGRRKTNGATTGNAAACALSGSPTARPTVANTHDST